MHTLRGIECVFGSRSQKIDTAQALNHLHAAVRDEQSAVAAAMLGFLYFEGVGICKDKARGEAWARRAIQTYNLSSFACMDCTDTCEQSQKFEEKSTCGSYIGMAKFSLGRLQKAGCGINQDHLAAVQMFEEAIACGVVYAYSALGVMYDHGFGVKNDPEKAVELFKQGADLGDTFAIYNLGVMHDTSCAAIRDQPKAVSLYQRAADNGHALALFNLGWMFDHGCGMDNPNKYRAATLYQKAVDMEFVAALHNLGIMHHCGEVGPVDMDHAIRLYSRAAKQDNPGALYELACLYIKGERVEQNLSLARTYLMKAATLGHDDAMRLLNAL